MAKLKISLMTQSFLKELTIEELEFLSNLAKKKGVYFYGNAPVGTEIAGHF